MTMLDDTLPGLVMHWPTCGHCGNDVTIEDGSAHCETCNVQWDRIDEDAEASFLYEDAAVCEIPPPKPVEEYDYAGKHWRLEFKTCILPTGHGHGCLWPHETTTTPIEEVAG